MPNKLISEELRRVNSGKDEIIYTLKRKNVKNFNLRIKSNSDVIISTPPTVSSQTADAFVIRKKDYIFKALNGIKSFSDKQSQKEYVTGESFRIEGKLLRLKVIETDKSKIESDGIFLTLQTRDTSDIAAKEKLVNEFYADKLKIVMNEILDDFYIRFRKYNISKPILKFRIMQTRWGSCSIAKNIITLNPTLIEAPRDCIEYVIMHELCHLMHPNHSREFYDFLSMQLPDWRERKRNLEEYFIINYHK